jgi:phage shock protein A
MGIFSRFRELLRSKAHAALDRFEDPEQLLEYNYDQLLKERKRIDRAVRDAIAHRNLIRGEIEDLKRKITKTHERAKLYRLKALTLEKEGGDDPKTQAQIQQYNRQAIVLLGEKARMEERLREVEEALGKAEVRINAMKEKRIDLVAKLEELRRRKEELKSEWHLAQAEQRITSALSGLEGDFGDVDLTLQRVEEKVKLAKARAEASSEVALEASVGDEEIIEIEGERELLAEQALRELDLELLGEGEVQELGPGRVEFFTIAISGGGTWAFPAEERDEILSTLNEIDEALTRLAEGDKLDQERFDELYARIFRLIRRRGKLVGRDIPLSVVRGDSPQLEPDLRLPPEDLEYGEALELLEGKGLLS